ncbi:MAG: hypothetical protein HZC17_02280 [Candidatus Omnitrophica bacterium]|nr:hypothetical protein [Candidatus Omnitrophota bacterium]
MDIYKRLLAYIKPFRFQLVMATLCMLVFALASSLVSITVYMLANGFLNKDCASLPIPKFHTTLSFSSAWVPLFVVAVFLVRGVFDYLSNFLMASIGQKAVVNVRNELYEHLIIQDVTFYSKGKTGDLISRIMNDVGQIQGGITDVLVDLIKQPFVLLINIPIVFFWDAKLAFVSLVVFPMAAIPIIYFGKKLRSISRKVQDRTSEVTSILQETFTGIRIVKAFNMEKKEVSKFKAVNRSVLLWIRRRRFRMLQTLCRSSGIFRL